MRERSTTSGPPCCRRPPTSGPPCCRRPPCRRPSTSGHPLLPPATTTSNHPPLLSSSPLSIQVPSSSLIFSNHFKAKHHHHLAKHHHHLAEHSSKPSPSLPSSLQTRILHRPAPSQAKTLVKALPGDREERHRGIKQLIVLTSVDPWSTPRSVEHIEDLRPKDPSYVVGWISEYFVWEHLIRWVSEHFVCEHLIQVTENGKQERHLVATIGKFSIIWNFQQVMKKSKHECYRNQGGLKSCYCYKIVLRDESIVDSQFMHEKFAVSDSPEAPLVVATPMKVSYFSISNKR